MPQYFGYLRKSKQKQDIHTAKTISEIINMAMIEYPEAQQSFDNYKQARKSVSATVDGVKERNYDVYDKDFILSTKYNKTAFSLNSHFGLWYHITPPCLLTYQRQASYINAEIQNWIKIQAEQLQLRLSS